MMSLALRRSVLTTTLRHLPKARIITAAAMSTQTVKHVETLEKLLDDLGWTDVHDEVKEIRQLMNEPKTNHAIQEPNDEFDQQVDLKMTEIENMIHAPEPRHDVIENNVLHLRNMMKEKMYGYHIGA